MLKWHLKDIVHDALRYVASHLPLFESLTLFLNQCATTMGFSVSTLYLALYNCACAIGWALCLRGVAGALLAENGGWNGVAAQKAWADIGDVLVIVQTAAALEILHAILRLVRSPVVPTIIQVSSRLMIVWLYMKLSCRLPS